MTYKVGDKVRVVGPGYGLLTRRQWCWTQDMVDLVGQVFTVIQTWGDDAVMLSPVEYGALWLAAEWIEPAQSEAHQDDMDVNEFRDKARHEIRKLQQYLVKESFSTSVDKAAAIATIQEVEDLAAMTAQAVAAERTRCAKVCRELFDDNRHGKCATMAAEMCAIAIERGTE